MKTAVPIIEIDMMANHRAPGWRDQVLAAAEVQGSLAVFEREAWRELSKEPKLETPKLKDLVSKFTLAISTWAEAGFPVVIQAQFDARMDKCQPCEHWDSGPLFARCLRCGCTSLKLWLATETCPVGKWDTISKPNDVLAENQKTE